MTRPKTDQEISAAIHTQFHAQVAALRVVSRHAPYPYIAELIAQAADWLAAAETAWQDEERQAGRPLWR